MLGSRLILPLMVAALLCSAQAEACPNCKEAVAAQDPAQDGGVSGSAMGGGYNYSVLFMMAMPFALLGTGAFLISRAVRRGAFPEM